MFVIWEELKHIFYVTNSWEDQVVYHCTLKEFIEDEKKRLLLLDTYGNGMKATTPKATVMYMAGWLGYLCAGIQYFFSQKKIMNLDNIHIQLYITRKNKFWISFLVEEDFDDEWNEQLFESVFNEIAKPLLTEFSKATNIPAMHLWGQVVHSYYWVQHRIRKDIVMTEEYASYLSLLNTKINTSSPSNFGLKVNPFLKPFVFVDNPWDNSDPLPIKPSCCLAFQTEDGHKCYTCPRKAR